jgi:hypothetical protein
MRCSMRFRSRLCRLLLSRKVTLDKLARRQQYELLDAQTLLTAMSTSDDVEDRRRAYDIGAELLRDRSARESGHVMVLNDAAINFLTETIEGNDFDNRIKALVHVNNSLKHWASAGTQEVSVIDVSPLLSLLNRTVASAAQSEDQPERRPDPRRQLARGLCKIVRWFQPVNAPCWSMRAWSAFDGRCQLSVCRGRSLINAA